MRLSELFEGLSITKDEEVLGLSSDTRTIKRGEVFFALEGTNESGERYIAEALKKGAVAIVSGRAVNAMNNIVCDNVSALMKSSVERLYGFSIESMKLIGITGTNGKTTTSHMIYDILNSARIKTGLVGTLGAKWAGKFYPLINTTPGFFEFAKALSEMHKDGVKCVICEVSAHAIEQNRLLGTNFNLGIFTNLTQDHLDYFKSMQEYKKAKFKFFSDYVKDYAVVNVDTEEGIELYEKIKDKTITYGITNPADVFGINFKQNGHGEEFVANIMDEIYELSTPFFGAFNRYNLLAAITTCRLLGVKGERLLKGVDSISEVPGRFNVYKSKKTVIIDYAHTPDGLENVLKACRQMSESRVICVFGCGGERDCKKRAIMGKISEKYADIVILTEDNSRGEKTEKIISDIRSGMTSRPIIIPVRKEATEYAIKIAEEKDVVLIAGKGAEEYIEKEGKRFFYSDAEEVKKILGTDT